MSDVMAPVLAPRIAAREHEQRGGMLDDDAAHMDRFGDEVAATALLDFEAEAFYTRQLCGQSWCLVFTFASLGVTLRRFALSPVIVHNPLALRGYWSVFEGRLGTGHDAGDIRVFSGRPWFLVCSLATSLVALCVLVALTVLAVLFLLAFGWGCRHR
jgi:hypothetical protein